MSDLETFKEQVSFVRDVLGRFSSLRMRMTVGVRNDWQIGADDSRIVDIGIGSWVTVEGDAGRANNQENGVADWIALANPDLIGDLFEIIHAHLDGLEMIWDEASDDARERISVPNVVMTWAKNVDQYLLKKEVIGEDGEWSRPRRRLGVTEWEEDL